MEYKVFIYSREGDYPFREIYKDQRVGGNRLQLNHGIISLGKCTGVDYDTQVVDYHTQEPVDAFCSDDDFYFLRTDALISYMRRA